MNMWRLLMIWCAMAIGACIAHEHYLWAFALGVVGMIIDHKEKQSR